MSSIATIERILADAEQLPDPAARALCRALAAALVDLTGEALQRILSERPELARQLADDDIVGNVLVLCNLHPDAPAVRAERALAAATKQLGSVGVSLDGVEVAGAGIRVRLSGERGTPTDADRVRTMVDAIVMSRAPDVDSVMVELGGRLLSPAGFVPVDRLRVTT